LITSANMTNGRRRRKRPHSEPAQATVQTRQKRTFPQWLPTCLVALILALPGLSLPYLWDDFYFLRNALAGRSTDLLPDPNDHFYRPLSRGVYFGLLNLFADQGAAFGHVLNLALLLFTVWLLYRAVERIANGRVALASALAFSSMSAVPFLVTWISACQDLLA